MLPWQLFSGAGVFDMGGIVNAVFVLSLFCSLECVLSLNLPVSIVYKQPADCIYVQSNYAYFFNSTSLGCSPCAQNIEFQTASSDGKLI